MEKTYTTRNNKREDNLTTTEAILKVLTRIYWMKKEGKPYFVSVICDECRVMHLNKNIVESLYDWKELPTWALAEECRQQLNRHAETWPSSQKKNVSPVSPVSEPTQEIQPIHEPEGLFDLSGTGVIKWIDGHRYQITRLD